jgi:hypothetical protein
VFDLLSKLFRGERQYGRISRRAASARVLAKEASSASSDESGMAGECDMGMWANPSIWWKQQLVRIQIDLIAEIILRFYC